jgi:hypothetical protein
VFLLTLVVTVLAKGSAFLPGYAIDDYGLVLQDSPPVSMLGQGRFGQVALIHLLRLLGLEAHSARVFFVAFAILVSSLLATLVGRYWNLRAAGWLPVAVASIVAIHPFTTEIFTFRAALGIIMCALAVLALLLVPRRWSLAGVVAGAILFAFALSIYQAVLQYCVMIVLMGTAVGLTRLLVVGSASGWPQRVSSLLSLRRILQNKNAALLGCAVLGTTGYMLVNAFIAWALHVTMGKRFGFLSYDKIGERIEAVWGVLRYRFLGPSPLLNQFTKGLLLLLLLATLVALLVRAQPWPLRRQPALLLLTVFALLAVSVVWTVGIIMVPSTFWPVPRVMSHAGVFWAGTLVISFLCAGTRARWMLGLLSLLIVLSFIGSSNRILNDQLRLNTRDAAKASRIIARLEALPGFSGTESVAMDGTAPGYPLGYQTNDMDLNLSAFSADWAKLAILREISGYDLKEAKDPVRRNAAAAYCQEVTPWPGPQSVAIQGRMAIVCLGPGRPR